MWCGQLGLLRRGSHNIKVIANSLLGLGRMRKPAPTTTLRKKAIVKRNWEKEMPIASAALTSQPVAPGGLATVLLMNTAT
jgi:hypothetical protein